MPTSSTARATPLSTTKRRAPTAPAAQPSTMTGTVRKKRVGGITTQSSTATSKGKPLQPSTANNKAGAGEHQSEMKRRRLDAATRNAPTKQRQQENSGGNTEEERPNHKEEALSDANKPKTVLSDSEKNMTVEQYLTSQAETLRQAVLDSAEEQVQKLKESFAEEKSLMQEAVQARIDQEQVAEKQGAKSRIEITISITEGPHHGIHKVLKPTQGKLLPKVGRSTGKHFLNHGISLPEDGEVSTTHGKFEVKQGILYFQDVGSTNGTLINGKEVEPYDLKQLSEGDIVQVGQSPITIEKISKITE